jgi:hypothetical protein
LVVICSLSTQGLSTEDDIHGTEKFFVGLWTREEYIKAVNNDAFFEQVKNNLDSAMEVPDAPTRYELIDSKMYFAGGSCWYMFNFSTNDVIVKLYEAIDASSDIEQYLNNSIGINAANVVNRLFGCYYDSNSPKKTSFIISQFAACQIGIKLGPEKFAALVSNLKLHLNPAMNGWLFEMCFFASISVKDVECKDEIGSIVTFQKCDVELFDPNKETQTIKT